MRQRLLPKFVNVIGGNVKNKSSENLPSDLFELLPDPEQPRLDKPRGVLVTGIGGTGVVTIGALIGMVVT